MVFILSFKIITLELNGNFVVILLQQYFDDINSSIFL